MTLHPTFDSLSSFADAASEDASQARVRRHVGECDACRATVAEIRAMGDMARAMPVGAAPPDLWERVAARRGVEVDVSTLGSTLGQRGPTDVRPAAAGRVASIVAAARRTSRRRGTMLLGAAVVVLALATSLVMASRTRLEASVLSRLVVSPARPAGGETIVVRYTPTAYFRQESRLVLIGRMVRRGERPEADRRWWTYDADSLATLLPQRDGTFAGRLTLPSDFRWMQLAVVDSTGDRMDRDGRSLWMVIGGNRDHSPSLDALISAQESRTLRIGRFDNHLVAGPEWSIADTIQRYFPGHPAGWAYYSRYGVRRGVLDFLRYFETAERKYASFDDALWPERALDAGRMHVMVVFARRIEEPLEAAKWATRLAREHPGDPRTFDDLHGAIHHMQLNSTKGLADSLRTWLPLLADVARRDTSVSQRSEAMASLAQEFGDSATKSAWPLKRPAHRFVVPGAAPRSMTADEERQAHAQLAEPCARPAGRFSFAVSTTWAVQFCELVRSNLLTSLSRLEAERGHASLALALSDSALRTRRPPWGCQTGDVHQARARAHLMLGDSARAVRDLAIATGESPTRPRDADSLLNALGAWPERARFTVVADSARVASTKCALERRRWDSARADSARLGVR